MKIIFFLLCLSCLVSCQQKKKKVSGTAESTVVRDTVLTESFPPLQTGVVEVTEEDFGSLVELEAESLPVDTIFAVGETQMLTKNGYLIASTLKGGKFFYVFRLADMKLQAFTGNHGKGPMEFIYPSLIRTREPDKLCYIYEATREELFYMDTLFNIHLLYNLPKTGNKNFWGDKQIEMLSEKDFLFASTAPKGKAIYYYHKDSVGAKEIYNLTFDKRFKLAHAYIGDFAVNPEKGRMVFAYKYFKAVRFLSLDGKEDRLVKFDYEEPKGRTAVEIIGPSSVTHYWGISAGKERVYLLYSGRTPLQVTEELKKKKGYIFVEEYDWNGNLLRKFRLNQWGYFHVNEETNTIYMAADQEQPFYRFRIPEK